MCFCILYIKGSSSEFETETTTENEADSADKSQPIDNETEDITEHPHDDRQRHTVEIAYSCSECEKSFLSPDALRHHRNIHTDAKPYSCMHCSESFTSPEQLGTHLLKSHNEGILYLCVPLVSKKCVIQTLN